jgi:hypothetical protein
VHHGPQASGLHYGPRTSRPLELPMKNLIFCFAIVLSSLNVRGDIKPAEEILVRVNDQKSAEVLMLFTDEKFYLGRARF